ncbi:hypothetical protein C1H46_034579 [Malus baccata]|uniref:CENP-V/GFA domain-containing protein n=1 Tax=Malus baccata TaxID=106549 RepID=A0A540L0A1_MALBA|nr:hypothetical protein C1H46_034579 [Malus baccata]
METEMIVHEGGCHCKNIRWRVKAPSSVVAWSCNCSNCSMRGNTHFIVPAERFQLLSDSKCVDLGTLAHVEIKYYDGQNWDASHSQSSIALQSKVQTLQNIG